MISDLIFVGSIFLVFVTIYLLFFTKNATRSYADYLLTATLLTHTWSVVLYLVLYSEYILQFPHLFKTGLPINFLIAPLSYLYVRAVLYNEKSIQTKDLLHAIPFLIVFINYIPFYILPVDIKLKIINNSLNYWPDAFKYQAGILPENLAILFRIILAIFYIVLQWKLIFSYKKVHKTSSVQIQVQNVLQWLKLFTITSTIILLGLLLFIFSLHTTIMILLRLSQVC